MSTEYDDLLSPTDSGSAVTGGTSAALPLPLPIVTEPQEPHNFTEEEVGEYKETDRYLPVRAFSNLRFIRHTFCHMFTLLYVPTCFLLFHVRSSFNPFLR